MDLPLDWFFLHVEAAKRYSGYRRKEEFIDLVAAIAGSFSDGGAKKHLESLDNALE